MTATRRWIALLLLAALLFAAAGYSGSVLAWAVLAPLLLVFELIILREEVPEFRFAAHAGQAQLSLPARAPPLP